MKKYLKIIALFFIGFSIISCEDDGYEDFNAGETAVQGVSGEWYVKILLDNQPLSGYYLLDTYNTASNSADTLWINDNGNLYDFKVKTPVTSLDNKTFGGDNLVNQVEDYEINVNINNGKILTNEALTEAGNVSDSIYFEAEFSDDPGTIYQFAGYRRTGFLEDEH